MIVPADEPRPGEPRPDEQRPAVLALRALGLGDFLTGVPAYRALARARPDHELVLAAPAALADLVGLVGSIDRLLPTGELAPIPWRGPPPRLAVDLHGNGPASHDLVAALAPQRLLCFAVPGDRRYPGPGWRAAEHEVARWCRLLTEAGIPADPGDLRLRRPAGAIGPPLADGPVVVHPGAASASRRWLPERFGAVARELRAGAEVVITGSAGERELAQRVAEAARPAAPTVVAGTLSLGGLADLIARAALVVCGDTGVAHLATALGRPSVTLFGPISPALWGPPDDPRHATLWPAAPDHRGDPHGSVVDPVLARITVDDVLDACERVAGLGRQ
jgi:ADP-heptose:LPS heptosyltransferase